MMFNRALLILTLLSLSFTLNAQSKYQSGYYIDNSGNRVEGFILNRDWKNNPKEFRFRKSTEEEFKPYAATDVREFGITGMVRFGSFTVDIDRSGNRLAVMSREREPNLTKETLFLRYAVEGEINLLAYSEPDLKRYFINKEGKTTQLVYKPYRDTANKISYNNDYKFQLLEELKCENIDLARVRSTEYSLKGLSDLFVSFNTCKGADFVDYRTKKTNDNKLQVSVLAGYQQAQFSMSSASANAFVEFDDHSGFVFGAEVRYQLPFSYGRFSLVLQPVIQNYQSEEKTFTTTSSAADYTSLMLPVLMRRYFPVSQKFSLFANAGFLFEFPLSDGFEFVNREDLKTDKNSVGLTLGIGGAINETFSIELKHNFERDLISNFSVFDSPFSNTMILVGYTIFKTSK